MSRFKQRQLQWTDIIERFEAKSYSEHAIHARGMIERLRSEGDRFLKEPDQLRRWCHYCTRLLDFLSDLDRRRDSKQQSLETVMREFIQEFEHSAGRMRQILYGALEDPDNNEAAKQIMSLFELIYRVSTYAVVSAWIPDKHEETTFRITFNLKTGDVKDEGTHIPMCVPKKHQKGTKRL